MEYEILKCNCYDIKDNFYKINKLGKIIQIDNNMEICSWSDRDGYQLVNLLTNNNIESIRRLHRIVASQYIHTNNYNLQVNHIDGDKTNNAVWNLEWVTCKQNIHHAIHTGLRGTGENHPTAIYDEDFIIKICELYEIGYVPSLVAIELNLDFEKDTIKYLLQDIYSGKRWKQISCNYTFLDKKHKRIQFRSRNYTFQQIKDICLKIKCDLSNEQICKDVFNCVDKNKIDLINDIRLGKSYTSVSRIFW